MGTNPFTVNKNKTLKKINAGGYCTLHVACSMPRPRHHRSESQVILRIIYMSFLPFVMHVVYGWGTAAGTAFVYYYFDCENTILSLETVDSELHEVELMNIVYVSVSSRRHTVENVKV